MGKDKDAGSKEDLVEENERLSGEVDRLQQGLEEVQGSLQAVDAAYQQSKAAFSLARYGQLKNIVKRLISDEALRKVQSLTQNQTEGKGKGGGMAGLVHRAREFASHEGAACKDHPQPPKSGGGSKLSGLFQRVKYATGFSEEPPDIRFKDKEDIRRDNEHKKRQIRQLNARGRQAHTVLQQLKERYEASKKHAPPARYQELKDMIKDVRAQQI